jgi:hypothetical protein
LISCLLPSTSPTATVTSGLSVTNTPSTTVSPTVSVTATVTFSPTASPAGLLPTGASLNVPLDLTGTGTSWAAPNIGGGCTVVVQLNGAGGMIFTIFMISTYVYIYFFFNLSLFFSHYRWRW